MKSLSFFVCFILFCFSTFAQKQTSLNGSKETEPNFAVPLNNTWLARFEKRQTKMIQFLALSNEQKHRLDTLNDNYVTQRAVINDDKSINVRTRMAKIEALRREREVKFKNMLTSTQTSRWDDLRRMQKKKTFRKK